MANELAVPSIVTTPGKIQFSNFEEMKASAQRLVTSLNTVEVTPESVATAKKLRAKVNSRISDLNQQRIAIKKDMEEPYQQFKNQLDEITDLVDHANRLVDAQIKQLEADEKAKKSLAISKLYAEHHQMYEGVPFTAQDFLKIHPQVLNKSVTIDKAEETLAQWLNDRDKDIKVIEDMPNAETVLGFYKENGGNLSDALASTQDQELREKQAKKVLSEREPLKKSETDTFVFTIKGAGYGALTELLLKNNDIPYHKEII